MSLPNTAPQARAASTEQFVALLPAIQRIIQFRLRCVPPRDREELQSAAVAAAFVMFVRLLERDRTERIFATPLAQFGVCQALDGRTVGSPVNSCDIASRACQRKTGVRLTSLHRRHCASGDWRELVVEDRRASPADTAAARIDFADWLTSLPAKKRQVAELLAGGETTQAAARHFRVSPGRVSQLRRELEASWREFQPATDA